jgi:hypothetical protein
MALSANRDLDHYVDQELRSYPVVEAAHIFKAGLVGLDADGYARPLTAGDHCIGLAYEEADNTGGSDGDLTVRVYTQGDFAHALSGATIASLGRPVFASADDTLTFQGAGNSYVGIVQGLVADGEIILRLDPTHRERKSILVPVENLGTGGDIAARAAHVFDADAWVVGARIVNQEAIASGVNDANTAVVALSLGASALASITFDSTTAFPDANAHIDMGNVANAHAAAGEKLTLSVITGTTANLPAFTIELDYV